MHGLRIATLLVLSAAIGGCSALGVKSIPWPTSTTIHNAAAIDFLRGAPAVEARLGEGLVTKDISDGGKLVGLSVSGGGARATAFTLGVLTELSELPTRDSSRALERIDFISSNSGGSWAVAAYLADRATDGSAAYRLRQRVPVITGRFFRATDGRVRCWSRAMREVTQGQTFGSAYSPDRIDRLPAAFFNASLLPAHAPFVFTDQFISYYDVRAFGSCSSQPDEPARLADLPIGYAAAASGTVPGFYHAYAQTGLCTAGLSAASFCNPRLLGGQRSFLRLADGGLYDNIAYKTAYEAMQAYSARGATEQRAMLLINSGTSSDYKTIPASERSDKFILTTAKNGIFAVQDSTFERLYGPMFRSLGADPVLLDFFSTAKLTAADAHLIDGSGGRESLDALAFYAAQEVKCFIDGRLQKPRPMNPSAKVPPAAASIAHLVRTGGDCMSENFYRAGTLAKTTYAFDEEIFEILYELGRLSVRKNARRILAAVD